MKRTVSRILGVMQCILGMSCSSGQSAGGTMETENSVAFQVLDSLGKPAPGVSARIRPTWYLGSLDSASQAWEIRNLVADKAGWVRCENLPNGFFRVEVGNADFAAATEFGHSDTTAPQQISSLVLQKTGTLQGNIDLPAGVDFAWVQIFGSELKVQTDASGYFEFSGIPNGNARIVALSANTSAVLGEDIAVVRAGQLVQMGELPLPSTQSEDPYTWKYAQPFLVDSMVPDWMRPLSDTTMLILRLGAENFDFSQCASDGHDLRFYDPDNRPLVYERVYWNVASQKATLRIRVSGSAQNDSLFIAMRWGRAGAVEPDTAGLWENVPDTVHSYLTRLVFGNFESGLPRTDLPQFLPATYWYAKTSDSATIMNPAPSDDIVSAFQSAGSGRTGKAAHFTYTVSGPYGWVMLGAGISKTTGDFTTLDSIVFYAKGNGNLSLALDRLEEDSGTKALTDLMALDTVWTRYRVLPGDFLPASSTSEVRAWTDIQGVVTNLTFFASNGNEFWMDSVVVYGVGVEDLH